MTGFDYTVAVILLLSAALGWWRGVVYEALSLAGWIGAGFVSRFFSADLAPLLPEALGTETARLAFAFAMLFAGTLVVGGIMAWLVSKLVKWIGLSRLDRSLGALFGVVRGVLVVLVLVLLAGMTALPQQPFWRDALMSRPLETLALNSLALLPQGLAQRVMEGLNH